MWVNVFRWETCNWLFFNNLSDIIFFLIIFCFLLVYFILIFNSIFFNNSYILSFSVFFSLREKNTRFTFSPKRG